MHIVWNVAAVGEEGDPFDMDIQWPCCYEDVNQMKIFALRITSYHLARPSDLWDFFPDPWCFPGSRVISQNAVQSHRVGAYPVNACRQRSRAEDYRPFANWDAVVVVDNGILSSHVRST